MAEIDRVEDRFVSAWTALRKELDAIRKVIVDEAKSNGDDPDDVLEDFDSAVTDLEESADHVQDELAEFV